MRRFSLLLVVLAWAPAARMAPSRAAAPDALVEPAHRIRVDDPAWTDLFTRVGRLPDATADFEEHRWFPFRRLPTVLTGEARMSAGHGLSLHYLTPRESVTIVDERGLVLREEGRDTVPPSDPRAAAAFTALFHLLRFELRPLAEAFDLYGERDGDAWTLALVPRAESLRRTLGQITVAGTGTVVRRIELRRSVTQRVEILVGERHVQESPYTADELRRYFR